ncbi:MAG TPA: phosphoribosyltransferase family protein [Actinomycetota bacterium]|nr:phosphoribosyltransferase family protein [Actinomycetota bacterium]
MVFADREEAGRILGERLAGVEGIDWPGSLVLGIPRGGVIVAAEVARVLGAELDVAVPAKIRAPFQPELAIGAVGPGGAVWLDLDAVAALRIPGHMLDAQIESARHEVARRTEVFRGDRAPPAVEGRPVVLVDDGIATGATIVAAARAVRAQGPSRLLIGVPLAPGETLRRLAGEVDQVVCLESPEPFMAVGQGYIDFRQVGDDAVRQVLPHP